MRPRERPPLTATTQPLLHGTNHHIAEVTQHPRIALDPIIPVVAPQFGRQFHPDLGEPPRVPHLPEPRVDLVTGLAELLFAGLPSHELGLFGAVGSRQVAGRASDRRSFPDPRCCHPRLRPGAVIEELVSFCTNHKS